MSLRLLAAIEALPADARPKIILHGREPIPRTHTGKVQRRKLVPLFAGYHECIGRPRLVATAGAAINVGSAACAQAARPRRQ